jgi:hypothetical protein
VSSPALARQRGGHPPFEDARARCRVVGYRTARWRCNSNGTVATGAHARTERTPGLGIVVTGGSDGIGEGARTVFSTASDGAGAGRTVGLGMVLTGARNGGSDRAAVTSFAGVGISDAIGRLSRRTVLVTVGAFVAGRALGLGVSISGGADRRGDAGKTRGFGCIGKPGFSAPMGVLGAASSGVDKAGGNNVRAALASAFITTAGAAGLPCTLAAVGGLTGGCNARHTASLDALRAFAAPAVGFLLARGGDDA